MSTIGAIGPATAPFLVSDTGRAACAALANASLDAAETATLLAKLRRTLAPEQAGAVLTLARLRQRAAAKFPEANRLFFTPEALEQATALPVALHRAQWLDRYAPPGAVLDLGCGIGGDLLALAQHRCVIAYELDLVRALFARANAAALGLSDRIEVHNADRVQALQSYLPATIVAAFADPARRVDERRIFRLDQLQPAFGTLLALRPRLPVLGVKVMPGVTDDQLPAGCGVEFVSHQRACKEAVIWFGAAAWCKRWGSIVTTGGIVQMATDTEPPPVGELAPGQVLYEPDPALIRARCLSGLCERYGAHLFDPQIAYLVGPTWKQDSLAQAFTVEEVHPFGLKLLNQRLQALAVGRVELKKRGFPVQPEQLRPRLKLTKDGGAAVVIFTRRGGERVMVIGRRLGERVNG